MYWLDFFLFLFFPFDAYHYIVNPNQLLGGNGFDIYTVNNSFSFSDSAEKANAIINHINRSTDALLPLIHDTNLYRIDFCANLYTNDPHEVELYIKLLKMYDGYKKLKLKYDEDKDGKEYTHELYTKLTKNDITFYAYNKYCESSSKPHVYTDEDRSLAYGVLRLEIQIMRSKIYNEKRKLEVKDTIKFFDEAILKSKDLFSYYLKKLFFTGDYQSYDLAIKTIDNSSYTPATKVNLKKLIWYVSDTHGVQNGINAMKNEIKEIKGSNYDPVKADSKISKIINKLNDLNINPVTIPRRDNVDYLLNLLEYFPQ